MAETLMQNRTVVVGRNHIDAREYAAHLGLEDAVIVSAAAHALTISGGLAGMHVARVYITETAPEGVHYDTVSECLERAKLKNPSLKIIAMPRAVKA